MGPALAPQDEVTRTVDALSRLKREGEVGVSARGLVFASEEKLHHAHRPVLDVQERMNEVIRDAVDMIQSHAEPSGREPAQQVGDRVAVRSLPGRE